MAAMAEARAEAQIRSGGRSPWGVRHETIRIMMALRLSRQTAQDVRGGDALLVVETADTSLRCDLDTKAPVYAVHGVHEYWVINAVTLPPGCTGSRQGSLCVGRGGCPVDPCAPCCCPGSRCPPARSIFSATDVPGGA